MFSCRGMACVSQARLWVIRPSSSITPRLLHSSAIRMEDVPKPPVSLIAQLRKIRAVPMSLAREALVASNNDLDRAVAYLDKQLSSSEAKAAKVAGRSTHEGVIALSLLSGKRVGMVHLACETDFVARNEVFVNTARDVASTAAFLDVPTEFDPKQPQLGQDPIQPFPISALLSAPIISLPSSSITSDDATGGAVPTKDPTTVQQSLNSALGSTGENLRLVRAATFAAPFPSSRDVRFIPGCYAHGGKDDFEGRVAALVVLAVTSSEHDKPIFSQIHGANGAELEMALAKLARTLAKQVVGFPTKVISRKGVKEPVEEGEALLDQQFMMIGEERRVGEVLGEWGKERGLKLHVTGMRRWSVSDPVSAEAVSKPPSAAASAEQ